ncbi:MAG: DUF362 domain-containing protein [Elusimicrobia bacterium]|nr:DUF362 domain-containing protein [Elusimicrobiota bacterium]
MNNSMLDRLRKLIKRLNFGKTIRKNELVAIKVHFGEEGLTTFLNPVYVRPFSDEMRRCGAHPFLTDANTIYRGSRSDGVRHINTALKNGFGLTVTGAPVIIADGISSEDYVEVEVNCEYFKKVMIAGEAHRAGAMIVLSHFKGHEMFGFGGAVKNIGMGLAVKRGKLQLHSTTKPIIKKNACTRCGLCMQWCPAGAIYMDEESSVIDQEKCLGCGKCIMACPSSAVRLNWDMDYSECQKKTAEFALGVLNPKRGRIWFFNFLMNITPECDCYGFSDSPIAPDIGILASEDPVAADQASYDLVCKSASLPDSKASGAASGQDKFRAAYPQTDPDIMFGYAEKIGLGSRSYNIIEIK